MENDTAMVIFQPSGRRGKVPKGITIIEASRLLGADIETLCGEEKSCGKCLVRIEAEVFEKFGVSSRSRHAGPWLETEAKFISAHDRKKGFRLGCAAKITGDLLIFVPESTRAGNQIVSKAARDIVIDPNPAVKLYHVVVSPPTFEDPAGDFERISRALEKEYGLKDLTIDLYALRQLPVALREGDWEVTVSVWHEAEIIRVRSGKKKKTYGLAIDIGTTTVAAYFCDLTTMEVVDTVSMMNPQCKYGEDVMARITYHLKTPGGLQQMQDDIIEGLNSLIATAVNNTHPSRKKKKNQGNPHLQLSIEDIEDITIGCNTAMHHIFLGLDPKNLGLSPFPPVIHHSLDIKARDVGLHINPSAYIYVLPIEAGFVGADNVGVLIAEEPYKQDENQLIIDIGTNGELLLGNRHKLISSSCATGPALEGAQITFGMRAAPGAIERVEIDPVTKEANYKVIGRDTWLKNSEPADMNAKGICGSGILDLFAELYLSGVITKTGLFNQKELLGHPRFRKNPETDLNEFVLAWAEESSIDKDIVITQKDIRQIQLAKGALYTGCKLMIKRMGLEKVDRVKIAGAFGTHLDPTKAMIMGLFPDCDIDKIEIVGNAAGDGCRIALFNTDKRREAEWCSRNIEYIELTVEESFQQEFMESMHLPHMKDRFPNLKGIVPDQILNQ